MKSWPFEMILTPRTDRPGRATASSENFFRGIGAICGLSLRVFRGEIDLAISRHVSTNTSNNTNSSTLPRTDQRAHEGVR